MPTQNSEPTKDDVRAAYEAVNQHWSHAEQVRWSLLNNFLTANSILLLGWATIFVSTIPAKPWDLLTLSVSGVIISCLWWAILCRANKFVEQYGKLGEKVEEKLHLDTLGPFHNGERIRNEKRLGRIPISSRHFALIVPIIFIVVFIILIPLSWFA